MNGHWPLLRQILWFLRDVLFVVLGTFILLHETLAPSPRETLLMVGVALLMGPAAIRTVISAWFGKRSDDS